MNFFQNNNNSSQSDQANTFISAIVTEVINSPEEYLKDIYITESGAPAIFNGKQVTRRQVYTGEITKFDNSEEIVSTPFQNFELINFVPMNTIAVQTNQVGKNNKSVLCFPFFPPHISLPIKVGEYVWIIKETSLMYYWFCRKTSYFQVDDINYTHLPRQDIISRLSFPISNKDILNGFSPANLADSQPGNYFEKIQEKSWSYKDFIGEPVPRIKKEAGDFLVQGSNNSYVHLGTEKFEEKKSKMPTVDIGILRKHEELLDIEDDSSQERIEKRSISAVKGNRSKDRYFEINKTKNITGEGDSILEINDFDIYDSAARIYISNSRNIDDYLGISSIDGEQGVRPSDARSIGDNSSVSIISANTRVVGNETIALLNNMGSLITMNNSGEICFSAKSGAKIVLSSTGDIKIIPGSGGIVKIGEEDPKITPVGGFEGSSIITTAGGLLEEPPVTGQPGLPSFSKKVKIS